MKKFFSRLLMFLGAATLFMTLMGIFFSVFSWWSQPKVNENTIISLDLTSAIIEYFPEDPLAMAVLEQAPVLIDIVAMLEKAASDDKVVGLVAKVDAAGYGLATIEEIREAVMQFKKGGKKTVAYTDTFGEFGPANAGYYLATAFDSIYLQPSGDLGLTGLVFETPFLKGTLDKLGVTARMDHRKQYKSAMNTFTQTQYTEAHREANESLMNSRFGVMVERISQARDVSPEKVRALFDKGILSSRDALDEGLVDALSYHDEIMAALEIHDGQKSEILKWNDYLAREGLPHSEGKKTVALIFGVGPVHRGKSGIDPMSGDVSMGAETVTAAFREALEDSNVKAILFRVNSPGGSYVASDTIRREVLRAKKMGVPVIVSMGDLAASGGYFVSMAADKIVAQPGTITGSIGVFAGKMLTSVLWDKLGVSWDEVHTSENSLFWSGTRDYTPEQWQRFQLWLDRIYNDFTSKVAQDRDMPLEKVQEIARGRVWSGKDALRFGLVDELGGIMDALKMARKAADISETEQVMLRQYPAPKGLFKLLMDKLAIHGLGGQKVLVSEGVKKIRPLAKILLRLQMIDRTSHPLILPPEYWLTR